MIELKDKSKRKDLLRVLRGLSYVGAIKAQKDAKKAKFLKEFAESLKEIEASERGEVKLISAKDLLRELRS